MISWVHVARSQQCTYAYLRSKASENVLGKLSIPSNLYCSIRNVGKPTRPLATPRPPSLTSSLKYYVLLWPPHSHVQTNFFDGPRVYFGNHENVVVMLARTRLLNMERLWASYLDDKSSTFLGGQVQGAMSIGAPRVDISLVFQQERCGLFVSTRTGDVQRPSQSIRQGGFDVTPSGRA